MDRSLAMWQGFLLGLPSFSAIALAGEAEISAIPDKSSFTFLNPTPRAFMRELVTDRPDKTESPYTVDAGHFQLEMDLVSYTYDQHNQLPNSTEVEGWAVAPVNLKLGLMNDLDAQLILETYNIGRQRERATGVRQRQEGFGDVTSRLKYNLWGDDGEKTAMALMPFVKLPTNQGGSGNNSVEGGLIIPLGVGLPGGFDLAAMTEFDVAHDGTGGGYHPDFINSVTIGRDLIGKLGGYVEFFSLVSGESRVPWVGTFDVGFTYGVTPDIQLDCGVNIGVTRSADDLNPFIGFSFRY